jgi:hypothetical protein
LSVSSIRFHITDLGAVQNALSFTSALDVGRLTSFSPSLTYIERVFSLVRKGFSVVSFTLSLVRELSHAAGIRVRNSRPITHVPSSFRSLILRRRP